MKPRCLNPSPVVLICHYAGQPHFRGSEKVALDMIWGISRRGFSVLLVSNHDGLIERARADCAAILKTDLACASRFLPGALSPAQRDLQAFARVHNVDLIHANSGHAIAHCAPVSKRLKLKLLGHLHARHGVMDRFRYRFYDCHHLIGVSQSSLTALDQWVSDPNRLSVVHNAVSGYPTAVPVSPRRRFTCLCVSGLTPEKGVDRVIEAFAQMIRQTTHQVVLQIAGDGPEMPSLKALVRRLGLYSHVEFLGQVNEVDAFYANADLLLLGSRSESFGLVVLEAATYGVPTIAPRVGGLPEVIVEGQTGLMIEPPVVDHMATAILGLIRDPERLEMLSRAAKLRVLQFSPHRFIDDLLTIYDQVMVNDEPSVGVDWLSAASELIANQIKLRVRA